MSTQPSSSADALARAADREAQSRAVARVSLLGVVVSAALLTLVVVIATVSGSLTLTAVAVDSTVDIVTAVVLWLGLKLAERRSPKFPYGLYKVENILQIVIALLLFLAAYEVAVRAVTGGPRATDISAWVIAGTAAIIAVTWLYGWYASRVGRRVGSPALVADGKHRQTDVLASSLALVAVVSTALGLDVDRVAAVVIAAFAAYSGWRLLVAGMKVLLDAAVDPVTAAGIERVLSGDPLVEGVADLAVRSAGRYLFLEATLRVRTDDLARAHAVSERLEERVRAQVPAIERVNLHLEPRQRETWRVAAPLAAPDGRLSAEFGEAPYFGFVETRVADHAVLRREVVANPIVDVEKQRGILVAEWLVERGVDALYTLRPVNKGPSYVFAGAGVELREAHGTSLDDLVAA
jgi:cation diffusion facilitator family transporter